MTTNKTRSVLAHKNASLDSSGGGGERGERCSLGRPAPAGRARDAFVARRAPRGAQVQRHPRHSLHRRAREHPTQPSRKVHGSFAVSSTRVIVAGRRAAPRNPGGALLRRIHFHKGRDGAREHYSSPESPGQRRAAHRQNPRKGPTKVARAMRLGLRRPQLLQGREQPSHDAGKAQMHNGCLATLTLRSRPSACTGHVALTLIQR